jgi:hypothetical protein
VNTKLIGFVAASLFIAFNTLLYSQTLTPLDIVNSIYKPAPGEDTGAAFGLDADERRKFFSKATVVMWDKADKKANPTGQDVGAIDFDISTNTQGANVKSFVVVSSKTEGKRANVVVKLELDNWIRNNPNDNIVRYEFVQEDGRWMIGDVSSSIDGKGWTLKKLLAVHLKH